MSSHELAGRYRDYKTKTKRLLQWINTTASRCSATSSTLGSSHASKGTDQNSEHREAKSTESRDPTPAEASTKELLRLVRAICFTDPPVQVPYGILLILRDGIAGREACAAWYSAQALQSGGALADENSKHKHFIKVLRDMLDLFEQAHNKASDLAASVSQAQSGGKSCKTTQDSKTALNNLFALLDLEEPSSEDLLTADAATIVKAEPATTKRVPSALFLEEQHAENTFKTWCFLQDLADVRQHVKQAWADYIDGKLSFVAVGVLTDTAMGLLRRVDEEFSAISPFGSTEWCKLLEYLGIDYFVRDIAVWMHPKQNRTRGTQDPESSANVVELLCPIAYHCFKSWKDSANEFCKVASRKKADELTVTWDFAGNTQFHEISLLLLRVMGELHPFSHWESGKFIARDEFLQALEEIHMQDCGGRGRGVIRMWAVVGCQIYMDLLDMLGDYRTQGVSLTRQHITFVEQACARSKDFKPANRSALQDSPYPQSLRGAMQNMCKGMVGDMNLPAEIAERLTVQTTDKHSLVEVPRGSLIAAFFPGCASNILAELKTFTYEFFAAHSWKYTHILSVSHIFYALRAQGLVDTNWLDLEFAISQYSPKRAYATAKPPYDRVVATRHYQLALGGTLDKVGEHARERKLASGHASTRAKGIGNSIKRVQSTPLLGALTERYARERKQSPNARTLEAVLGALAPANAKPTGANSGKKGSKAVASTTPCELLDKLRASLLADEPIMNFDFLGLTIDCDELLTELRKSLKPDAPDGFDEVCVQQLLLLPPDNPIWRDAARIMKAHITSKGHNKFSKLANEQCSGRIPKLARPQVKSDDAHQKSDAIVRLNAELVGAKLRDLGAQYAFSGHSVAAYHPEFSRTVRGEAMAPSVMLHRLVFSLHGGLVDQVTHEPRVPLTRKRWDELMGQARRSGPGPSMPPEEMLALVQRAGLPGALFDVAQKPELLEQVRRLGNGSWPEKHAEPELFEELQQLLPEADGMPRVIITVKKKEGAQNGGA